jgi:hypothetical protein
MAKQLVITAVVVIVFALLALGVGDVLLILSGRPTVTDYLRENPRPCAACAAALLLFAAWLTFHLWVEPL